MPERLLENQPPRRPLSPLAIVLIYIVVALAWLFLTDSLLLALSLEPESLTQLSLLKGVVFVGLTGTVLLVLLRQRAGALRRSQVISETNAARLRALFAYAPEAIIVTNTEGEIVLANAQAEALFVYTEAELLGHPVEILVPTGIRARHEHLRQSYTQQPEIRPHDLRGTFTAHRRDGSTFPVRITIGPIHTTEQTYIMAFLTDVAEIERAQQAEREQQALAAALRDTVAALTSTLDLETVMLRILENVSRVVPHEGANIALIDGDDLIRFKYWIGYEERPDIDSFLNTITFPLSWPYYRQMINTGKPCLIEDTQDSPDWGRIPQTEWIRSFVGIPIQARGEVIGFLGLDGNRPGYFTPQHAERLQVFADYAAIAIENAHQFGEVQQDVDERTAELEAERAQLKAILDSMAEAVIYVDGYHVRYINPAFTRLFGYTVEQLQSEPARTQRALIADAETYPRLREAIVDELFQGRPWQGQVKMRHASGDVFDAGVVISPVGKPVGEAVSHVWLIRDISQEKALQDQKDRFIANAAHELRTPVTTLTLQLYLLERQPEKLARHLAVLQDEVNRLTQLINDLLDASRLERGAIELSKAPLDLNALARSVVEAQTLFAQSRQIALTFVRQVPELRIQADGNRLHQVITNLVVNAINYSQADRHVTVETGRARRDGSRWAVVRVADSGMGITPEQQARIFEAFYRASEHIRQGTGLGLNIAQRIMRLHGGEITVESEPGQGSTFTVWLPLVEQEAEA